MSNEDWGQLIISFLNKVFIEGAPPGKLKLWGIRQMSRVGDRARSGQNVRSQKHCQESDKRSW